MKNLTSLALGLVVLLAGCSQTNKSDTADRAVMMAAPPEMEALPEPRLGSTADAEEIPVVSTRLLIYHADVRLKVENLPAVSNELDSLVRRSGGYLSAATESRADGEWRQVRTIRVQPSRFSGLLAVIGRLGTVEEKKLTTDDVTAEHADVSARLRTKRAVEQRYVALLSQAKKIAEILSIEEKIGEVREEIESTESRLKTLNDEVAYSTITLTCYQPIAQAVPDAPIVSFGSRLVDAFYTGWVLLTGFLIGLISLWPFLLLGSITWWMLRRWRQRSRTPKPAASGVTGTAPTTTPTP